MKITGEQLKQYLLISMRLVEVLGYNKQEIDLWWRSPQMALNQQRPLDLLRDNKSELLMQLLGQIESGVYI